MNIRVDLNTTIKDGTEVVFRSPVDCSAVTGLKVYYMGSDGNTASQEFVLADAHGNNVGDIDHLFAENVVVKVILDVTTGMAFVQNADTNAYIERTFIKTINGVTPDKKGNVVVEQVSDEHINGLITTATGERLTDLETEVAKIIAELDYKPIDITKFTNSAAGTYEMGRVINSLTISWELNKTPASQTLKGETLGVNVRSKTYTNVSTSQNYSLSVKDERGATDSASSSVTFYNGVYYGVMEDGATINDAAILALTRKLQGSRGITFTANAGSNKRHAYALPTRYGTPVFKDADTNLGADFYKANSQPIQFTNASGYTESYDVWLSTNKELGSLTVAVS